MSIDFSLAHLTVAPMSPPDAISLAARCGYRAVGLRALPAFAGDNHPALVGNAGLLRETRARAKSEGVAIFDMEIVRITETFDLESSRPFIEVCGELGAKAVLVGAGDADESRFVANYAAFCDAVAPYGLSADLEFLPWSPVSDVKAALRVVTAASRPNGGILVDSLHAARSRSTTADIANIPADLLHYAQICDAPAEIPATVDGLLQTARHARLLPGDGGIDLRAQFDALRKRVPVSIELPNDAERARRGVENWAKAAIVAARATLSNWMVSGGA